MAEVANNPNTAVEKTFKHLILLIHGLNGTPEGDMKGLKFLLKRKLQIKFSDAVEQNFEIHAISSNRGKTNDGIIKGSERIFEEVLDLLKNNKNNSINLSIIGHSLGGIYGRYLIFLLEKHKLFEVKLNPFNFFTLATPHLGSLHHIKQFGFNSVPSWLSNFLLTQTIRDLMLLDEKLLMFKMCTEDEFLIPLKRFCRRVIYRYDLSVSYETSAIKIKNNYFDGLFLKKKFGGLTTSCILNDDHDENKLETFIDNNEGLEESNDEDVQIIDANNMKKGSHHGKNGEVPFSDENHNNIEESGDLENYPALNTNDNFCKEVDHKKLTESVESSLDAETNSTDPVSPKDKQREKLMFDGLNKLKFERYACIFNKPLTAHIDIIGKLDNEKSLESNLVLNHIVENFCKNVY
ncbi:hypothetical protein HDU92_007299 [Lobulomyces angularis]|nr:hypothetical protein HDU92_007299 [Lobulomyces angularis]